MEQLTKVGSERQLELDNLRAQNKLLSQLQVRVSESAQHVHATEASVSEASLRSATITSDVAGFTPGIYTSLPRSMEGDNVTEPSMLARGHERATPPVQSVMTKGDSLSVGTSNSVHFHMGLNVSATPFPLPVYTVNQGSITASDTSHNTHTQAAAYNSVFPSFAPPNTPVQSGSNLSICGSNVPRSSAVMPTGVNQSLFNHTSNLVQPVVNASVTTERVCLEVASMSLQVPPVPKYTGNTETEPEWLEQFELVASVCH